MEFFKNSRKVNYDTFIWHWLMCFINKPRKVSREVVKVYKKVKQVSHNIWDAYNWFWCLIIFHTWNTILYSYAALFQKTSLLETINGGLAHMEIFDIAWEPWIIVFVTKSFTVRHTDEHVKSSIKYIWENLHSYQIIVDEICIRYMYLLWADIDLYIQQRFIQYWNKCLNLYLIHIWRCRRRG